MSCLQAREELPGLDRPASDLREHHHQADPFTYRTVPVEMNEARERFPTSIIIDQEVELQIELVGDDMGLPNQLREVLPKPSDLL